MRRTSSLVLSVVVLLSVVLVPAAALAAPAAWQRVDVALHSEQSGGVMLVSGELPPGATLPAEAELSVPAGYPLLWIGQIMGGDPSADPALTYTKATVGASDVYRFTLTQSRIAQVEVQNNGALPFDGTNYEPDLNWTATQGVPEVRVAVRVPQGAQVVRAATGATMTPAGDGYAFYAKTFSDVKAGDQLGLSFAYQSGAPSTPGASTASSGSGSTAQVLVILLVLGAGVAGFVAIQRKSALAAAAGTVPVDSSANGTSTAYKDGGRGGRTSSAVSSKAASLATADVAASAEGSRSQPSPGTTRRKLVTAGLVVAIIGAVLVVVNQTTKPQFEGDSITQTFSQGQPCSSTTVALEIPTGSEAADIAERLFGALEQLEGMNTATLNTSTSSIDVGFCESKANEDVVRQALLATGLVAQGAAAPAAQVGAAAASTNASDAQVLTVDASSGSFVPTELRAGAGVPLEITFGQGTGCTAEVVFPELQIRQSLEGGPVTITLPALEPGTYSFECGMDMAHGTLVVQ